MPEEINRMVTDSITTWFFTTSETANENLRCSGVEEGRMFFVGNTMIDTLLTHMDRFRRPSFWDECQLKTGGYFVTTLHRPSNVDDFAKLEAVLCTLGEAARGMPVLFPVHPRTVGILSESDGNLPVNLFQVEPQPYLEFNYLVKHAKAVITDSGGITEEATVMGVPCLTLRDTTERPETVTVGTNELIGTDPTKIKPALDRLFDGHWKKGGIPKKWDGRAGERIVTELERLLSTN